MKKIAAGSAAFLVQHTVAPHARMHYEEWIKVVRLECQKFKGFQGVTIIDPVNDDLTYSLLVYFDNHIDLQAWIGSEQRQRLVEQLSPLLLNAERLRDVADVWLTPPHQGARQAKPFKQFLLTLSAIYPLSFCIPAILKLLTEGMHIPSGLLHLAGSIVIVWLMVYVVMPRYIKAVSGWLFR